MPSESLVTLDAEKNPAFHKLNVLGSLVPARVIRYHLAKRGDAALVPFSEEYNGAVLFADISGFSSLAEKLAKDLNCEANAAENLSSYIGKSLEKMVHAVCSKGGDVIKFAGDAILAVFPESSFASLSEATLCCTQVALNLLELELHAGGVELSVHCGVGAGSIVSYHVGGMHGRWEYVITGDPVDQIGSAEPEAEAGEVVIALRAYQTIAEQCEGNALPSGNFRVSRLRDEMQLLDHGLVYEEFEPLLHDAAELERMQLTLRSYVPRPVLQAIDSGQSLWFSELRKCSTLFCRLKGLHFNSTSNLDLIHKAVLTVQDQIYAYEGTLCRFIVDDKGAGLLLAFGLPPYMHENDPVRAIRSALEIHRNMKLLHNDNGEPLSCSIGVTSGRVFCGTAGGGIRCEYTLHGTLVNLAARYMVAAKDGVLCGEVTYKEAQQHVDFEEPWSIKVKGKEETVRVFRPIGAKVLQAFDSASSAPIVGRVLEREAISTACHGLANAGKGDALLVCGEAGIGKSKLMEHAYSTAEGAQLTVLLGIGVDTEQATPLFVFKSILSQLIPLYYKRYVVLRFHTWQRYKNSKEKLNKLNVCVGLLTPAFFQVLVNVIRASEAEEAEVSMPDHEVGSAVKSYKGGATSSVDAGGLFAAADMRTGSSPAPDTGPHSDYTESYADSVASIGDSPMTSSGEPQLPEGMINDLEQVDAPLFTELPESARELVLLEMVPDLKDGVLRDMLPLLQVLIPKFVEEKDNSTTEKMKKEVRAQNMMLLVKEIICKCAKDFESNHVLRRDVELEVGRMTKATSLLGLGVGASGVGGGIGNGKKGSLGKNSKAKGRAKISTASKGSRESSMGKGGSSNHSSGKGSTASEHGGSMKRIKEGAKFQRSGSYRMRWASTAGAHRSDRIVLMIDDVQWIDPASVDMLEIINKEVRPLLMLLSSRGGGKELFSGSQLEMSNLQVLRLGNLGREEIREGMCSWLGVKTIPDKALGAVMEKSGGHPLFAAELAKLMEAENMILVEGDVCKLSKKAQEGNFGLPDSISALMTSKLDRLPPSQQLALKVASVIGAEFQKHELLALMPKTDDEERNAKDEDLALTSDMLSLEQAGLLTRDAYAGGNLYRFTNGLLRESAYNLLLFQKRKDLHRKLAEFYEARNRDYLEPVYFLLANHYYLAEVNAKAAHFSELAGNDALDMHAMQQVLICFLRLLELDKKTPEDMKDIGLDRKVGWNRKVGEALLHLGKVRDAEEHFRAAKEQTNLFAASLEARHRGKDRGQGGGGGCFGLFRAAQPKVYRVKDEPAFRDIVEQKQATLMLEASNTCELLGKINNDRGSAEALEHRLNAIDLSLAAESILREREPESAVYSAALAGLARSYANAAVFNVCIGLPGMVDAGRSQMKTATLLVENVKDSETQALVHSRSAEFAAMVGDLEQAHARVRKALWVCHFLNFERMDFECLELSVAISTFKGNFGRARKVLEQSVLRMSESSPNYAVLALAARIAIFVGDFDRAEASLERIGRLQPGDLKRDFMGSYHNLLGHHMPETQLVLSLLLVRKYGKNDLAITAAIRGTELLRESDLSDLPLVRFHTAAFLFTAFAEGLAGVPLKRQRKKDHKNSQRMSFSQVVPYDSNEVPQTSKMVRRNARKHLLQVLEILKSYADVYRPCEPHYTYCFVLHKKILAGKAGQAEIKTFLQAAEQAQSAGTMYVAALSQFQAGLIDRQYMTNAIAAFHDCTDAGPTYGATTTLHADAPYELQLLEEERMHAEALAKNK